MPIPDIKVSAVSSGKSGDAQSSGSQYSGEMNFGGSGSGGGNGLGNSANIGALLMQNWPIVLAGFLIWKYRAKLK